MSIKKLIVFISCCLQAACATPARMSADELSAFKIDCNRRNEQYQFLESQKYSPNERLMIALQSTSIVGILSNSYNGTSNDTRAALNMEHEAMIKAHQRSLRQYCPFEDSLKEDRARTSRIIEEGRKNAMR
jgi:hypothetical protein